MLLAAVHAVLAVLILIAVIWFLKRKDDTSITYRGAIVTNGLECSEITAYVFTSSVLKFQFDNNFSKFAVKY